jgi:hypothetical protein
VPPGANLNEALGSSPDLWWNSLTRVGAIGRGLALAISLALACAAAFALRRARRLAGMRVAS